MSLKLRGHFPAFGIQTKAQMFKQGGESKQEGTGAGMVNILMVFDHFFPKPHIWM